ncbi:MAG: CoA-binding protein [Dehalococcoidia bacterium]|nr:CoA-binding protein [Dehalococcoidia bacterium]
MNSNKFAEMEAIFNPRSVAIIGASPGVDMATLAHIKTRIRDRLFLVNPKYTEIFSKKCYPSVLNVEEPLDYAIISVNASLVCRMVEECIQKGIKCVQVFSAGFSETGLPEGAALEQKLRETAAGKIRLIGPNCFGIYCPRSGLAIIPESTEEEGHIGVIAQSGSVAELFSYFGRTKNISFSKVVSYGNAADLDCPDFLEYLADDPDTHIIALYIEGSKDGRRLKEALTYAAGRKPVFVIKGGMSDSGNRAARSHTGQLTGTPVLWRSLFRQCGAVQVSNNDEMMNVAIAFTHSPMPRRNGVAMIANSGGLSVMQTDLLVSEGMNVPRFSDDTIQKLRKIVPVAGTSIGNPLDAWPLFYRTQRDAGNMAEIIRIIAADKHVDLVIFMFDQFRYMRRALREGAGEHMQTVTDLMLEGCSYCRDVLGKPVFLSITLDPFLQDEEERNVDLALKDAFQQQGFPVFPSNDAAARAVGALYKYDRLAMTSRT